MAELSQERIERARRNQGLVYWIIAIDVAWMVFGVILLAYDKIGWLSFSSSVVILIAMILTAVNNRRILRGKRPWIGF